MDRVKVGLIGFGLAGSVFHAPLLMAEPRMRLTAIATSRALPTDYASLRAYPNPKHLIASDEVDLIVIATPNETHAPLAEAALEAGKHVVIDKPFAIDVKDADKLMALATRQERLLSVFHNRRWDGNFLTARAALARGDIGEINYCEIHFDRFRPVAKTGWRETNQPGSGVLYDLGPHLIDQALCLFGVPEAVIADVAAQRDGVVADDYFHLQLIYKHSLRVVLHASCLVFHDGPRLVAHGNKGSLVVHGLDGQEAALAAGARPGDPSWGTTDAVSVFVIDESGRHDVPVVPGAYEQYYRSIAEAILEGQKPAVTAKQARDVMAVLDAARQSAAEHRWVSPVR